MTPNGGHPADDDMCTSHTITRECKEGLCDICENVEIIANNPKREDSQ